MSVRRLLFLFLLIFVLVLLKPQTVWAEFKRIRSQWDTILRLLVIVVIVYLLYGFYTLFSGGLPW